MTPLDDVTDAWTSWDLHKKQGDPRHQPLIVYCKVDGEAASVKAVLEYSDEYGVTRRITKLTDDGRGGKC